MRTKIMPICVLLLLLTVLPMTARAEEGPFASGDRVVIWHGESSMAVSGEASGNYQAGTKVTVTEGILTGYGDEDIWTVTENGDGSWRFENDSGCLSLDEESFQLVLGGSLDSWNLVPVEGGNYRVVNRDNARYLTWYSAREVYGAAKEAQDQNILCFTVISTAPEVPENPENPEESPEPVLDTGDWNLYFGQLHAHTADSDGEGTVAEAFSYGASVKGLDFFAVTDHSDSFDNDEQGTLTGDGAAISARWAAGQAAAEAVTSADFVGIYGFEMTWNQGQGHMSTFNTSGWLSRDQEGYQNYQDGLENYYEALLTAPESISQFNHPDTVLGNFKDFAWHSPQADAQVTLIEVGSGVGGEYRTAYEYYTRALDRGWHLAPTNNQNNHEGAFGDAGTNCTVVLAKELTREGIYDALRNRRAYATEDSDLQMYYTLNGLVMGSELSAARAGDSAEISVSLLDPTDTDWGTVEVITAGGTVAVSAPAEALVNFSLPTDAAYYYIRVTQADGDIAVTAPVWLRQTDDLGISALGTQTPLTRAGENQNILLTLYNNETEPLTISSVTLTDQEGNVLGSDEVSRVLARFGTVELTFPVCFDTDGIYTVTATVRGTFEGAERSFARTLDITVLPAAITGDILIDGTHGADWNHSTLSAIAVAQEISLHVEGDCITAEQLADCDLLVIPAPQEAFEAEFLLLISDYVNRGGNLLLLGGADGVEACNRLLAAIGSSMSLGGEAATRYTADINETERTEGITEGQIYAHTGGRTVAPGDGEWLVKDPDGAVLLAVEGSVILAGGDFLADAWLRVSGNNWSLPYANRTILENLLGITRTEPRVAPIGTVRAGEPGRIYLVEGRVTAGTQNSSTTFPNTIYLQDATGGIAVTGYSERGLELGHRVRIVGCLETSGGNPQLEIVSIDIFEKADPLLPEAVGNHMDYATQGGELLLLEGTVISAETEGEAVHRFVIKDENGARATVWIEDTIFSGSLGRNALAGKTVQVGNRVSAVGLCHRLNGETVLRVRDCDEVLLLWAPPEKTIPETVPPTTPPNTKPTTAPTTKPTMKPTTELTTEPTTKPTTEPAAEPATEPTTKTEPATEPTAEPTRPTTKPATGQSASVSPTESPSAEDSGCLIWIPLLMLVTMIVAVKVIELWKDYL